MISSTANAKVKAVAAIAKKNKVRREEKLFIVEGPKMFSELPVRARRETYVAESYLKNHSEEAERLLKGVRYETVSDSVMEFMADTKTPQGILAVASQFSYTLEDVLKVSDGGNQHLIVLETLQDPGNLGTIIRAGEGAGITGVIMNDTTADIYNPKVVRATMGSIYRVPFIYVNDLEAAIGKIKAAGVKLYAAHLKGTANYDEMDFKGPTGFMIGNEAKGLSDKIADLADSYVKIPMAGKVESLNAAIAASVLMFETARQRRQ